MLSSKEITNTRIDQIYKLVENTERSLHKLKEMLRSLDMEDKRDAYRDVPGITGTFDGVNLVSEDGKKLEVPTNYSAKSRLVFGDTLKLIEEDGKQVFKQIEKIERKKVEGILTKKEGKWYIISDSGTYKVSDIAADFQHAELNDEAVAFVPANNLNSPYAALDKVNKKVSITSVSYAAPAVVKKIEVAPTKRVEAPVRVARPAAVSSGSASSAAVSAVNSDSGSAERRVPAVDRTASRGVAPKVDNRPRISEIGSNSSTGKAKPRVAPRASAPKVENTKEFVASLGSAPTSTASDPSIPAVAKSLDEDDLR